MLLLPAPRIAGLLPAGEAPLPDLTIYAWRLLKNATRAKAEYYPIHSAYQPFVQELVSIGAFEHHPEARKRTWYGITDKGRALVVKRDRLTLSQQGLRLRGARYDNFERLCAEQAGRGFFLMPEPGRGPDWLEVAFFNPGNGRRELYRCRLGSARWYPRVNGYYQPAIEPIITDLEEEAMAAMAAAIPF